MKVPDKDKIDYDRVKYRMKRSYPGTALYVFAVLLKVIAIAFAFLVITDSTVFLQFLNWFPDYFDQSNTVLFFSAIILSFQVAILGMSVKEADFSLGAQSSRPYLKASIFLFTPFLTVFIFYQARMYNLVGWQMIVQVILDVLIFAGLMVQLGGAPAKYLRPFRLSKRHRKRIDPEAVSESQEAPASLSANGSGSGNGNSNSNGQSADGNGQRQYYSPYAASRYDSERGPMTLELAADNEQPPLRQ